MNTALCCAAGTSAGAERLRYFRAMFPGLLHKSCLMRETQSWGVQCCVLKGNNSSVSLQDLYKVLCATWGLLDSETSFTSSKLVWSMTCCYLKWEHVTFSRHLQPFEISVLIYKCMREPEINTDFLLILTCIKIHIGIHDACLIV